MASCHCSEIASINRDLEALSNALDTLNDASRELGKANLTLQTMSTMVARTYTSDSPEHTETALKGLTEGFQSTLNEMVDKINTKSSELATRRDNLQSDDNTYHEEQRLLEEQQKNSEESNS